jgi:60 kDa SS-A/Ro ribonucleoprotein
MTYRDHFSTKKTPQSEKIPGKTMVQNSAGGYTFQIDDWARLGRFLILGSEKSTYYASAKKLTIENAEAVTRRINEDGPRVVNEIVQVSEAGRAPKNDPALFALAMCAGLGDLATRRAAFAALPHVARIGTHLFHFLEYVEGFRGWGRGLRRAVANWYNEKPVDKLAYQVVKYQQRDGWSHRDALRLAHPNPGEDKTRKVLYTWITGHDCHDSLHEFIPDLLVAFELAKSARTKKAIVDLVIKYGLTREMIPTQWLNEPQVWAALLEKMPLTAMVRNLGKMTTVGVLKPMSDSTSTVIGRLIDPDYIKKSRLHPLTALVALRTYAKGKGIKGSLQWEPVASIIDALDEAFYLSFGNVESTGKRTMLSLDVSGSMGWGNIAGMPITPREASAAMALVTSKAEPRCIITAFSDKMIPVTISDRQRLDDVIRQVTGLPFGGTDCALPMIYALENGLGIDTFIIYTDNETWFGDVHPGQVLDRYRREMNIPAKLIVVGMTATEFSIADPSDGGMLDVVGFDTAAPQLMADFAR